jgi:hypothetical protein
MVMKKELTELLEAIESTVAYGKRVKGRIVELEGCLEEQKIELEITQNELQEQYQELLGILKDN